MGSKKIKAKLILVLLLVSLGFTLLDIAPTAQATSIFLDGFDNGVYVPPWTGTSGTHLAVSSDYHHHGTKSSKHTPTATFQGNYVYKNGFSGYNTIFIRWYWRVNQLPTTDSRIILLESIASDWASIYYIFIQRDAGGTLKMQLERFIPSDVTTSYTYAFQVDTWYYIEVKYAKAVSGEYRVYLGGSEVITDTGIDTSAKSLDLYRIGTPMNSYSFGAMTGYLDCVAVSTDYNGAEVDSLNFFYWYDDFNDNSLSTIWTAKKPDYLIGYASIAEQNAMLNLSANSGTVDWSYFEVYSEAWAEDLTIQVDGIVPSPQAGAARGYLMIGNMTPWSNNYYLIIFGSAYGGIIQVWRKTTSTTVLAEILPWKGNYAQYRMVIVGTSNITFYVNDQKIVSDDCSWLFTEFQAHPILPMFPYNMYVTLGSFTDHYSATTVLYDNFWFINNEFYSEVRNTVYLLPTDSVLYSTIYPTPKRASSQTSLKLRYLEALEISFNCFPITGFYLDAWWIINGGTSNYTNIPHMEMADKDFNVTSVVLLSGSYRLLNIDATSYGIDSSPAYGAHAYLYNSNHTVTATKILIDPPGVYVNFTGWYENNALLTSNLQTTIQMWSNRTIESRSTTPIPINTWEYRSVIPLQDTPPAPPLNGTGYQDIVDDVVSHFNVNGTKMINYVSMRLNWYWNLSMTPPKPVLIEEPSDLGLGDYYPTQSETRQAIQNIHAHGLKVWLGLARAWETPFPTWWQWDNATQMQQFFTDYWNNVVQPIAQLAEEEGVESFAFAMEFNSPLGPEGAPYIWTSCNALWNTLMTNTRSVYHGLLAPQVQGWYNQTGVNVWKQATYLQNVDYIVVAMWVAGQVLSPDFTALDVARGWYYNPTFKRNYLADFQDIYLNLGRKMVVNCGYANAYGTMSAPWSGRGEFRDDKTQYLAWQGLLWAFQSQTWVAGQDFERFNENYFFLRDWTVPPSPCPQTYFATSIRLVNETMDRIRDELWKILQATPYTPEDIPPHNVQVSITNMDPGNTVYAKAKYYVFQAIYSDGNGYSDFDTVKIAFTDGTHWINASFNGAWSLDSGSGEVTLQSGSVSFLDSETMQVTFPIYFKTTISNASNVDIYMYCLDETGLHDGWEIIANNYFNIINYGDTVIWTPFTFGYVYNETSGYKISGNATITAYFTDGTPPSTFSTNGTYVFSTTKALQYFRMVLPSGAIREYWVGEETNGTVWLFDEADYVVSQYGINAFVYNQSSYYDILFPQYESNANYEVTVTLTWNSTYTIANKVSTGCRVNFETKPAGTQYLSWYVYRTSSKFTTYTIAFLDLAGLLKTSPIISAEYFINGTRYVVEQRKIDVDNKVQFQLLNGRKYTLVIHDGVDYVFGELQMTSLTTITLTLRGIDFPKETLLVYKYVRIYGLRVFSTPNGYITIVYQDILSMTNNVAIYINYRNGTNAFNYTITAATFSLVWNLAANDTDYQVTATINHQRYGIYTWKQYFPRSFTSNPWVLGWLGSLPFSVNNLVAIFIILVVGASFSMINPEVGAFLAVVSAAALTMMGWLPLAPGALIAAFCFSLMFGIVIARKRVQTG